MKTQKQVVRVWGLNDWASYYEKPEELDPRVEEVLMAPCPFHKGKTVADTHFAFMGVPDINGSPLTVAKWLELHPADGQPKFYFNQNPWHVGQPHTDVAVMEPRLYILLREIIPGSTSSTPEEQVKMLPPEYEVPSTIAEVTKDILVFRKTGKRCNGSRWAACSERTIATSRAFAGRVSCVGFFGERGICVEYWDGFRDGPIGVGASRKLDFLKA
jgi:hypothetical protein